MALPLLRRAFIAIIFIAASAVSTGVWAQFDLKIGGLSGGAGSRVSTPYVQAELVAHAPDGVAPGKPLWLGLLMNHQPDWHTYWKNPGDSGLPTQLQWTLPAGVQAGDIAWPLPRKIPIGDLANFGYEGQVLLPVPLTVAPTFAPGAQATEAVFQLQASWLVCRQECVPEEGSFTLRVPLQGSTAMHAALFAAADQTQPRALAAAAGSSAQVQGDALLLRVAGLPAYVQGQSLDVFPESPEVIHTAATPEQQWQGAVWTARVALSPERSNSPQPLPLVLGHGGQGWRLELPVPGGWPEVAAPAQVSPALQAALDANAQAQPTADGGAVRSPVAAAPLGLWLLALGGALLGGMVLNLMPCVFPVLAIKVVGFAQHGQDRRAQRLGGLAYTLGVVLSFVLLGALMLGLRAAGQAVGWGFQLQSPAVVASLALLFTLIGLNLAGLFELRSLLPSSIASLQARHPVADSFLTGVLAVAVASPCTAPFMGASLGLTATLPAVQALAVFLALGLGLALPYLLASWLPGFARLLPRPGQWMDTLRRLLAFPMFATVVWLVWVLGQQSGIDGAAALLALLVVLAMCVWALGLSGRGRWLGAGVSLALAAWLSWAWGDKIVTPLPDAASVSSPATGWQAWRPQLAQELLAQGRPVFVDYTAAWCVTCQYNKKTTLANAAVLQDFAAKNVALLRADWTRRDPAITAALVELGRSGVPVYVLLAPGRAPQVFSEILQEQPLRAALAQL